LQLTSKSSHFHKKRQLLFQKDSPASDCGSVAERWRWTGRRVLQCCTAAIQRTGENIIVVSKWCHDKSQPVTRGCHVGCILSRGSGQSALYKGISFSSSCLPLNLSSKNSILSRSVLLHFHSQPIIFIFSVSSIVISHWKSFPPLQQC